MSRMRVINLGLPKSGTTTLARALRRAGLPTADFRLPQDGEACAASQQAYVGALLYRGYFQTGDPLAFLQDFEALSEISVQRSGQSFWPQTDPALIRTIRTLHPQVKFVASWRDPLALSDSMLRWSNLGTHRLPAGAVPGLPEGFGATTAERVRWIKGHYQTLEDLFSGSGQLLRYDTKAPNAAERLSAYLGIDLPWWGHANANGSAEPASCG